MPADLIVSHIMRNIAVNEFVIYCIPILLIGIWLAIPTESRIGGIFNITRFVLSIMIPMYCVVVAVYESVVKIWASQGWLTYVVHMTLLLLFGIICWL